MFYYVYILQSIPHSKLYVGFTADLKKRIDKHNKGHNMATKPYIPYKLVFYEAFLSKKDAKNREEYLKSGYGIRSIRKMLKAHLGSKKNIQKI